MSAELLLFPETVASRMVLASRGAEGDRAALAKAIKPVICDGAKPKYYPGWKVLVVGPPDPRPGTPLDQTTKARLEHFSEARKWIQRRFFWEAATLGLIADSGADYWAYSGRAQFAKITAAAKPGRTLAKVVEFEDDGLPRIQLVDLALLIQLFTFSTSPESPTTRLSPTEAITERVSLWKEILARSTHTQEAPRDDGAVALEVKLNLEWFCGYSVALSDLVTQ